MLLVEAYPTIRGELISHPGRVTATSGLETPEEFRRGVALHRRNESRHEVRADTPKRGRDPRRDQRDRLVQIDDPDRARPSWIVIGNHHAWILIFCSINSA